MDRLDRMNRINRIFRTDDFVKSSLLLM